MTDAPDGHADAASRSQERSGRSAGLDLGRPTPLDAAILVGVPAVLVAAHLALGPDAKRRLALSHADPTLYGFYTSALVHVDAAHLVGNVVGYLLAGLYAYYLAVRAGDRAWFRRAAVALLVAAPPLVNVASYLVFAVRFPVGPTTRGFSGATAAFGGLLLVAVGVRARRLGDGGDDRAVLALSATTLTGVGALAAPAVGAGWSGTFLAALAGMIAVAAGALARFGTPRRSRRTLGLAAEAVVVGLALVVLLRGLFPPVTLAAGRTAALFPHAAGLAVGLVLASVVRVPRTRSDPDGRIDRRGDNP
ncbi:MAG: hypothetical protein ABEJ79_01170 [Halolamina sp.]